MRYRKITFKEFIKDKDIKDLEWSSSGCSFNYTVGNDYYVVWIKSYGFVEIIKNHVTVLQDDRYPHLKFEGEDIKNNIIIIDYEEIKSKELVNDSSRIT